MSNQRSVMTEFRFLDQKRQAEGLSAEETARYAQLRDLVGPETAGPPRSGFDVNAAAARLRESLLPAGLRSRPAEAAPPPVEEPPAAPPAPEALALEEAWAEAPSTGLETAAAEPLFDPGSLTQEVRPQAWNPEAPGYDPDAPYDEAAWIAAGYDPNATYDWSAAGYGPDGQPLAAEAAPADTSADAPAEGYLDASAEPAADPALEPSLEFVELPPDPAAPPAELAGPSLELTDAPLEFADAPLEPTTPAEASWDAEPVAAAREEESLPFDPNAPFDHAKWFGRAAGASPEPAPGVDPAPAFGEYDDAAPLAAPGLLQAAAPELGDASPLDPAPAEPGQTGADQSAAWLGEAPPATHLPAPPGAPFGAYDDAGAPPADGALAAMLSFDPAAASAIEPGAMPEGYDPGGPALDPTALPDAGAIGYDDAAFSPDQLYGGPEGDSLPGGTPLELGDALPDWQPEAALEQGFELASDGSFGHGEPPVARTPAWGTAVPAAPPEGWESAPALDLGGPFEAPSPTPSHALEAVTPAAEELPTIDGADLLEELPAEEAPVAPVPEEPSSAARSPLDGAFEDAAAVEAAAYPAPDLGQAFQEQPPPPAFDDLLAGAAPLEQPFEPEPAVSYQAPFADLPPEIAAAYADEGPASTAPADGPSPAPAAGDTFEPPPSVAAELFEPAPASSLPTAEPLPPAAAPSPVETEPPLEALEAEPLPLEALEAEPLAPPSGVEIPGTHRVVLHTVDGQVKRGLLVDALLDAPALSLQPQGPGAPEEIGTEGIKALFFMLAPGEKAPSPEGKRVRVTFRDGRQVAGFSPDYREGLVGFFMIPADTRTNTGRIWVYQAAVKTVSVS